MIKKMNKIKIKSKFNRKKRSFKKQKVFLFLSTHTGFDQTQSSGLINNTVATYSDTQHRASLPVTINLNPDQSSQNGNLPGSMTIPVG